MVTDGNERQPKRKIGTKIIAVLGALGILSAIGTLLVTRVVETGSDLVLEPLIVDITDQTSHNFLFPSTAQPEDAPPLEQEPFAGQFQAWAERMGGIPYSDRSLQLTLRGRDAGPVVIRGIRVRAVERRKPVGDWVNAWDGCGAVLPVRVLTVDLGEEPPVQQLYVDEVEQNDAVFQVSATEVEVFDIELYAGDELVSWVIDVQYSSRGKDGTMSISDVGGKPFQLAGGGDPVVYSTIAQPDQLQRDDEATAALKQEQILC
jgi:hypothetical protein